MKIVNIVLIISLLSACSNTSQNNNIITPDYITEKTENDTDDPAIWYNKNNPEKSLIVGTDKDINGAIYVYDLKGKIVNKSKPLKRPNNVDIGYNLFLNGKSTDFCVVAERFTHKLRFFSLPELKEIDNGGLEIFVNENGAEYRDLMGVSVYQEPYENGKTYIIAGRKNGPTDGTYLWQYELLLIENKISLKLVRKFGNFSGQKEIEAIAVDAELAYIYYSDESKGIRKYYANPDSGNIELKTFGLDNFTQDREGISIYKTGPKSGYIIISDQQENRFNIYDRNPENHDHKLITSIYLSTNESDGSDCISSNLGSEFPNGIFVAMSDDKTFQIYDWRKFNLK